MPNLPDAQRSSDAAGASLNVLCTQVAKGNRHAFERIFRRTSERVFRYAAYMTGSDTEAFDIVQDAFMALWERRDQLGDIEALIPYILQMVRHRVYNKQRGARTRRRNEEQLPRDVLRAAPPLPDEQVNADQLHSLMDQWIEALPPRQREALTLRRIDGLSHDDIAEVMDISPHTVNNHIVRAMDTLRERLRTHRPDLLA
ncbi:RNA polymerase sigma factor [Salisaeta longa]|uniref:RNA polymerase sigma factor n=1 Tax=Salisaeta longa TaxID=503170 RepID=UPI0003B655D4|nr:RNA polymerase sigma-70 factor [Salisaeta longa]